MRPVKFSPKTLIEVFYQHKVLNKEKTLKLSGCSNMTAWRILSKHGYMTSYNFNATYYTLADIPKFDKDGLWSYQNIRFSRYGSLTDTVTELVCSSTSGLDANELLGILAVNVTPTLTSLYRKGKLKREKLGGVFVYLHTEDKERQTQLTMRQSKRERALEHMALPEPERIIAVLVELINRVELEPQQITRRLSSKGIKIALAEIQAIFAHYQLPQKKTS